MGYEFQSVNHKIRNVFKHLIKLKVIHYIMISDLKHFLETQKRKKHPISMYIYRPTRCTNSCN